MNLSVIKPFNMSDEEKRKVAWKRLGELEYNIQRWVHRILTTEDMVLKLMSPEPSPFSESRAYMTVLKDVLPEKWLSQSVYLIGIVRESPYSFCYYSENDVVRACIMIRFFEYYKSAGDYDATNREIAAMLEEYDPEIRSFFDRFLQQKIRIAREGKEMKKDYDISSSAFPHVTACYVNSNLSNSYYAIDQVEKGENVIKSDNLLLDVICARVDHYEFLAKVRTLNKNYRAKVTDAYNRWRVQFSNELKYCYHGYLSSTCCVMRQDLNTLIQFNTQVERQVTAALFSFDKKFFADMTLMGLGRSMIMWFIEKKYPGLRRFFTTYDVYDEEFQETNTYIQCKCAYARVNDTMRKKVISRIGCYQPPVSHIFFGDDTRTTDWKEFFVKQEMCSVVKSVSRYFNNVPIQVSFFSDDVEHELISGVYCSCEDQYYDWDMAFDLAYITDYILVENDLSKDNLLKKLNDRRSGDEGVALILSTTGVELVAYDDNDLRFYS